MFGKNLIVSHKNQAYLKNGVIILIGLILLSIFLFWPTSSVNSRSNDYPLNSVKVESIQIPDFRLPWPEFFNGKVFFTGGPHEWGDSLGGSDFYYNDGTGLDFQASKDVIADKECSSGGSFPVLVMASGQIIYAKCFLNDNDHLGCAIGIKHDIGPTIIYYGHLKNDQVFQSTSNLLGLHIDQGKYIGNSGCTGMIGNDKPNHLHLELRTTPYSINTISGEKLGWETLGWYGGQIDGYWIFGYAANNTYGDGGLFYNYDGVAVKGNSRWVSEFHYIDKPIKLIEHVATKLGENFSFPEDCIGDNCENNQADVNTQFAANGDLSPRTTFRSADPNEGGILNSSNTTSKQTIDNAAFISDITLEDGTVIQPGVTYTKTWRMKNTGSTTWGTGYKLVFKTGDRLGASSPVTVPSTAPGQEVNLSVSITGPTTDGDYAGYWQLQNPQGTDFGPLIYVKVKVETGTTGGNITMFDVSPASPSVAASIHLVGRYKWTSDFRAMRFKMADQVVEGPNFKQVGDQVEISTDWNTSGLPAGNYTLVLEVAKQGDNSWTNPERRVMTYALTGSGSTNHAPDRPVLKTPYDWFLVDNGGSAGNVELCVHPSSDPDSDPVQYYFEVKDQGGGVWANSGWVSSTCWTRSYDKNTYSWRVKAYDGKTQSDWSNETWHFSVAGGAVYIGSHQFFTPSDPNNWHMCVYVTYEGIQGPNVSAWINKAADGSENGEWRLLDHYGPNTTPDCTDANYHGFWIRSPEYLTGTHKVKITGVKPDNGNSATKMTEITFPVMRPSYPSPLSPSSGTNNGTWWKTRSIKFEWTESLRATSYTLRASINPNPWDDSSPEMEVQLGADVTTYTYTFMQDYDLLYWSVRANNSSGHADSGNGIWFGIDKVLPTCQVQPLPASTYENVFQVNWNGVDASSGIWSYDIQYKDSTRGTWQTWLADAPGTKNYELFTGTEGHEYFFRCRATDNAGNTNSFPGNADTSIVVDLTSRPPSPWWDDGYAQKRNITLLNNMGGIDLPSGYTVNLRFSDATSPTSAEIYSASLTSTKCNDLRIVYNDETELDRLVDVCSSNLIDIWFRTATSVPAGASDNSSYQIYFGNSSAGIPQNNRNNVLYPILDSNTLALLDMREGSGTSTYDIARSTYATLGSELSWSTSGKFGHSILIPGDLTPEPRYAITAGTIGAFSSCNFTLETWLKRLAGHSYGGLIIDMEGSGGDTKGVLMFMLDGNQLRLQVFDQGTNEIRSNGSLSADTYFNNWHHIAVTHACNGEIKFYIDGVLDTATTIPDGHVNLLSNPLKIGNNRVNNQRLAGYLSGVSISNGVKTSFPYAKFASITIEPSLLAGAIVNPPITGDPDLAILGINTYLDDDGSQIVQVTVQNIGTVSTQNGFYTDLYLNHIPSGAQDFENSLRFWVNDSIDPGEVVSLTSVVTQAMLSASGSRTAMAETSGTLYSQTDSLGIVTELDKTNNLYTSGLDICLANADEYEGDDALESATTIELWKSQTHNFHGTNDKDWIKFTAQGGRYYSLDTFDLGPSADTYIYLYDTDQTTLLASNDDFGFSLGSHIKWQAPVDGTYYVKIEQWNPYSAGCGTSYSFRIMVGPTFTLSGNTGTPNTKIKYQYFGPECDNIVCSQLAKYAQISGATLTDSNGNYMVILPKNWSGKLIPEADRTIFDPKFLRIDPLTTDLPDLNFLPIISGIQIP